LLALRLAILIHPFGRFGGAERLAILHALGLTEAGHEVTLYTDTSLMHRDWLSMLGSKVPVKNLPYGLKGRGVTRDLAPFDRILIHHHIEPLMARRIVGKYADKTYWYTGEVLRAIWEDKITGQDYRQFSPTVFRTASHFYGKRSWIALWGPMYNLTVSMLRVLDMATVRRFKGIIANSEYMADLVKRVYRYPGPMSVAYPAPSLPASMFKPNYGNGNYVLAVGALLPNKNHHDLLKAMSLLKEPPTLRIVGDGQERANLKDQAQKLGLEMEFDPLVTGEQLCRLYEGSLFVVVPSLSEPFGMTALEAALAGKPSVVTELGGTKEFVLDQETGLVVNPRKIQSFATAMEQLLDDRDLRKSMGERARERALEAFTPERSAFALGRALGT
jgi:glycosyltransferase involved in cell wall biosynthesis